MSTAVEMSPAALPEVPDASDLLDAMDQVNASKVSDNQHDADFDSFHQSAQSLVASDGTTATGEATTASTTTAPESDPAGKKQESRTDLDVTAEADSAPKSRRFVSPKDFELLKVIGMGAFGKVLQVRNKRTQQILAMKVISKRLLRKKTSYVEDVLAERNILTKVRHPFVVSMHCSFQTREKLFIIMDFAQGGELFLRIGKEGIFLEKQAAFYLAEIILALDHLHTLGILHRDLKPENILLGSDGHVCLTDFGLARDFSNEGGFGDDDENRARTICGTQEYMSPEMVACKGYGRATDYWSLGCIAYEMLSGFPPFDSRQGRKELFRKIMTQKVKMPKGCSAAACKLLKGLLNRNVQARLGTARSTMFEIGGVTGLKKLEFFDSIDWGKLEQKEVEPPAVFSAESDGDTQYFHGDFTNMTLPRSVIHMTANNFRAHRVASDTFRGFSFIQEDFLLPERDEREERSYWDAVEEDGASISECASSKMGDEGELPPPEDPPKKKRPPRKRKKKKAQQDGSVASVTPTPSVANTPVPSRANSPIPSENGDAVVDGKGPAITESISSTVEKQNPSCGVPPERSGTPSKPVVEDVWQDVATSPDKKKTAQRTTTAHTLLQTKPAYQKTPTRSAWPQHRSGNVQRSTPTPTNTWAQAGKNVEIWSVSSPSNQGYSVQTQGGWNQAARSASQMTGKPVPRRPQDPWNTGAADGSQPIAQNTPDPPSSPDWRQHSMSPHQRQGRRLLQPPPSPPPPPQAGSWPSLGDPPLNPKAPPPPPPKNKLQGAWASRVKR